MDFKNKTMETVFAIAISTILMLIGIYYLPWVIFLYPVLFIILGIRYGVNYAILALIISTLSIGLMVDMISGIFIFVAFTPLIISLIYTIKTRKNSFTILSISTFVFLLSNLLIISMMKNMTGVSIINQLEEFFTQSINYQIEILKDTGLSNYEVLKIKDFLENAFDYILLIMPSIIMIFSLITAYLNYLLSSLSLRKLEYGIVSIPKFSRFKLPNNILLGTGIMFLGAFILKKLELLYYKTVFLNITSIIAFIFFVQGLSVIDYKLIKRNIKIIPRILIVIVFTIIIPLGWLIPFIGVLDTIFDFRKIRRSI
ncbi:DUF2232 domain-containing protein [Schnuerera ultunensis]|uniref:DUF2232 domain-containing protein n=1 Tax=[Clostridium] ultunense Esp TaxID=1288971 RepID=A0A1M4PKM3_9FIRM|nr:DUF2232 domain-containing protein [Schnuerera ultunensis]SHD76028.1 conserved membrane protein of unknown function [[Clostridium] ultunense Esp]